MSPDTPPARRRRCSAAPAAPCWPGSTGAGCASPACSPEARPAMHASDERLAAYLAGELDPDAARAVDEHLLACDRCWHTVSAAHLGRRAAERLRQPTPAGLADRIRLAIQLAPDTAP